MPFPTVTDDGAAVTLDLHGATVENADRMIRSCVRLAAMRGRKTLRLIHGTSTAEHDRYRSTIKSRLREILEDGTLDDYITDHFHFEGHTLVALNGRSHSATGTITLADLM